MTWLPGVSKGLELLKWDPSYKIKNSPLLEKKISGEGVFSFTMYIHALLVGYIILFNHRWRHKKQLVCNSAAINDKYFWCCFLCFIYLFVCLFSCKMILVCFIRKFQSSRNICGRKRTIQGLAQYDVVWKCLSMARC